MEIKQKWTGASRVLKQLKVLEDRRMQTEWRNPGN